MIVAVPAERRSEAATRDIACVLRWMFTDLSRSIEDDESIQQFSDKLTQAYEEINLLFRLARSMNTAQEPDALIEMICGDLHKTLPFEWLGLRFSSTSAEVPQLQGRLLMAGTPPMGAARFSAAAGRLLDNPEVDDWKQLLTAGGTELGRLAGSDVVAEPITHGGRLIGTLVAGGKRGPDPDVTSGEMQLLDAAGSFLGIFHENMARFAEQRATFMGTLKALTAAIDAKDTYTCGHSERVAWLARKLAAALGKTDPDLETYYVAGLVHDIGKIGIPEAVLCKPGKLDEAEFASIKRHPEIGFNILQGIPAMAAVLPGVRSHHERWGGRGYPDGLSGEQIPPMARVLAVADSFDAMSSMRSYRAAMPRDRVVDEIRRCTGAQFDPAAVEAFLALDSSDLDQMMEMQQPKPPAGVEGDVREQARLTCIGAASV